MLIVNNFEWNCVNNINILSNQEQSDEWMSSLIYYTNYNNTNLCYFFCY